MSVNDNAKAPEHYIIEGNALATLHGLIVDILSDGWREDIRDRACIEALDIIDEAKPLPTTPVTDAA
mgnify:CR=1 FL=1